MVRKLFEIGTRYLEKAKQVRVIYHYFTRTHG